jgi:hypothetical protein
MRNARRWLDGYLIDSLRGFSFYGLLRPKQFSALISRAGFEIVFFKLNEGSVYILAKVVKNSVHAPSFNIDEEKNFRMSH